MDRYPFIFSDEPRYRIWRHLLFWFSWWLFQGILYSFSSSILDVTYLERLPVSLLDAFLYMAPHIFLAYTLMYLVTPRLLLKGRYFASALAAILLIIATGAIASVISIYIIPAGHQLCFPESGAIPPLRRQEVNFFFGLLAGLRGGITVGGFAAAIKLMKYWYVKEQRNLQLQKENIASQLQLLKAQVHPHFLFNTLNNIYAHTQVSSPLAAEMIAELSGLLRYILYEAGQPLVPLACELKMLGDYIALEQIRYGNKLELDILLPENTGGLYIAPLLLLPFAENCFKHGASHLLEQPWISLHVTVDKTGCMKMKLMNAKLAGYTSTAGGIGISNLMKRLELLYRQKYQLAINNEEEVYIVNLSLQLEKRAVAPATTPAANTLMHA